MNTTDTTAATTTNILPVRWNKDRTSKCGRWRISRHEYVLPCVSVGWKLWDNSTWACSDHDTLREAKETAQEWNDEPLATSK